MTNQFEKNHTANAIKGIRKILRQGISFKQDVPEPILSKQELDFIKYGPWVVYFSMLVLALCFIFGCSPAHAYTEQEAIKTIVGEASNQGLIGMTAVAEVIRHKGSLRGFYGLHASHSAHEPKWVWLQAKKAWYASKTTNLTKYSDHFENIHAFGCPYWVKNCVLTFEYRDHKFYKEI